ncbi:PAS domain S-box-containing protein/diguanylate cyclase (GGDEF) domain-containing protein [Formivibrio citricus]|uniref:PAS domain S-box-containing protein/diguanylate cyclase (GGDEF) domain-containing protein n=1 Tax=Formivibrio citricus TaxID=83765 RepID=A0A1I4YC59_9NEIS|nr:EAL domain-containing protein [Formivibrio citricus]SFN35582.1 PAS domain S-box-containing protein/diguanylate cyclase (GGDEF) domain-containing protein [Formivibrio citricus]
MTGTLLLVDDEEFVLNALVRLLRTEGYNLLTANSGPAALEVLAHNEVHVILSDQRMPGMSGSEFLSQVRGLYPETVRLVLSGFADLALVTDAINRGNVYKYLSKPWDDELLKTSIREAFEHYELGRRGIQFTSIYENTQEGILITDGEGCIQAVNPAFSMITGYRQDEVVGKKPSHFRSGRHGEEYYRQMWRALLDEGKWTGEIWNRRKNGEIYAERLNITAVKDPQGKILQYVALFADITEHKRAEEALHHQAYHDVLTGLPNRLMYAECLELALLQAARRQLKCAVLMLDLDRFKNINDTFGHEFGDKLLLGVAGRLQTCIRQEDTLARMGGDEFAFLLPLVSDIRHIASATDKILAAFTRPVSVEGHELFITPSIGVSLFPNDGNDVETLQKHAEVAMYRAKESGRNGCQFYTADMNEQAQQRLELENDLRRAIERNELEMYYQPKVLLADGRIVGAEALIRWKHPSGKFVPPSDFIPMAEENGLIIPIGEWLIQDVCAQIRRWCDEGLAVPCVAINLSARQFQSQNLPDMLALAISEAGIEAQAVELELTESFLMNDMEANIEMMVLLKRMGFALAIDDFGTGYSSLSYLKRFPVDILKIDNNFVRDVAADHDSAELVRGVIGMAHGLKLEVVAEGVETPEQLAFLREYRCDMIQGYYFSRPLPAADFAALLREGKRLS